MMIVHSPPTTTNANVRVWMRPKSVGSRWLVPGPPAIGRSTGPRWSRAETLGRQIVGHPAGRRTGGRGRCPRRRAGHKVEEPTAYIRPGSLRVPMISNDRSTSRRPSGLRRAGVVEEVGQHPVLPDVRLQPGGVDDEVGRDLQGALGTADAGDHRPTVAGQDLLHLSLVRVVVAAAAPGGHLLLPELALRRVGAAQVRVDLLAGLAVEVLDLALVLPTPVPLGQLKPWYAQPSPPLRRRRCSCRARRCRRSGTGGRWWSARRDDPGRRTGAGGCGADDPAAPHQHGARRPAGSS